MPDAQEIELVQKIRAGDEDAARQFFRQMHPFVLRIVRNHLPARQSEEDLCQMIFLKAFSKLDQYSGRMPIVHWVSRIAVNTCLNEWKRGRSRPELREADLAESDLPQLARLRDPSQESSEAVTEARELVQRLLGLLSPLDRLVISLLHLEECPVQEVSALTGLSQTGVKVRAFRARRKLNKALQSLLKEQSR